MSIRQSPSISASASFGSNKKSSNFFYVGNTLVENGCESYSEGDFTKSLKCFVTALKTQRLTLGNEHICVAHTLGNIGSVYISLKQFEDAKKILEECLRVKIKLRSDPTLTLPPDVEGIVIGDTLNNLGNAAFLNNQYRDAMTYYQDALKEMTAGPFPGNQIEVANCLHNVGIVHGFLYELDDAIMALNESKHIMQSACGNDDLQAADTLEKIGAIYLSQNRADDALNSFVEVLRVSKITLGSNHVDCAPLVYNVGMAYEAKGDTKRAMESYSVALDIYQSNGIQNESVEIIRKRMVDL